MWLPSLLFVASLAAAGDSWKEKYAGTPHMSYSGVNTFAHLETLQCLERSDVSYDVGVIGFPFDTSVSYRPGARFGPHGIRAGSRRQRPERGYNIAQKINPYTGGLKILDCDDVPLSPYDNALAFDQMEAAYDTLLSRSVVNSSDSSLLRYAKDGKKHPQIVMLGGDHSIVLPALRSLNKVYGQISVIHFDAHLDTWDPAYYPGSNTPLAEITHGSFFHIAHREDLIDKSGSIHVGIRTRLNGMQDLEHDERVGFELITTDDIDDIGVDGIIAKILKRVGDRPAYLSFDIDTIDPGLAPATGTPESGGFSSREARRIVRGLRKLNFVGFDVVEVAPGLDHAEITSIAAADLVFEFLGLAAHGHNDRLTQTGPVKDEL